MKSFPIKQQGKIKQIFQDNWENFWRSHKQKFPRDMWNSIEEAVEKKLKCGSYENG